MRLTLKLIGLTVLLGACQKNTPEIDVSGTSADSSKVSASAISALDSEEASKSIEFQNNVRYKANLMSAIDFIKTKGERPSDSDIEGLKQESVLFLEFWVNEGVESVFNSEKMQMNSEDATKYLMGEIAQDITLVQGDQEFTTESVLYDGNLSGANKIRVYLFFRDLDQTKWTQIKYYDRLFGSGMINLKQKITESV